MSVKESRKKIFKYLHIKKEVLDAKGKPVRAPSHQFKTIPEKVINFLNEAECYLTPKEIADYLNLNYKSVSKSLTKLFNNKNIRKYMTKGKEGRRTLFRCNLPPNTDIHKLYKGLNIYKTKTLSIDKVTTVQRTPFEGTLLYEQCFLVSIIMNKHGCFETIHTPLPIEVKVID